MCLVVGLESKRDELMEMSWRSKKPSIHKMCLVAVLETKNTLPKIAWRCFEINMNTMYVPGGGCGVEKRCVENDMLGAWKKAQHPRHVSDGGPGNEKHFAHDRIAVLRKRIEHNLCA